MNMNGRRISFCCNAFDYDEIYFKAVDGQVNIVFYYYRKYMNLKPASTEVLWMILLKLLNLIRKSWDLSKGAGSNKFTWGRCVQKAPKVLMRYYN